MMLVIPNHHSNAAKMRHQREYLERVRAIAMTNPMEIFVTAKIRSARVHCLLPLQIDHRTKFG